QQDWVVYSKPPFGGPDHVLQYLARYTHRVAISNHRLLSVTESKVRFRWKDYANHSKKRTMTLTGEEFLRRFLQHVLPKGFPRIRYFGWLANRKRQKCFRFAAFWPKRRNRRPVLPTSRFLRNARSARGPCALLNALPPDRFAIRQRSLSRPHGYFLGKRPNTAACMLFWACIAEVCFHLNDDPFSHVWEDAI